MIWVLKLAVQASFVVIEGTKGIKRQSSKLFFCSFSTRTIIQMVRLVHSIKMLVIVMS
jgi:hypothetical protein